MTRQDSAFETADLESLRLFALGRIPRCAGCARYRALVAAGQGIAGSRSSLPEVPECCSHQVCAPLVDHYFGKRRDPWVRRAAACFL